MNHFITLVFPLSIALAGILSLVFVWDAFCPRGVTGWQFWAALIACTALSVLLFQLPLPRFSLNRFFCLLLVCFCMCRLYFGPWHRLLYALAVSLCILWAADGLAYLLGSLAADIFWHEPQSGADLLLQAVLSKTLAPLLASSFKRLYMLRLKTVPQNPQAWLLALPLPLASCCFMGAAFLPARLYPESLSVLLGCCLVLMFLSLAQVFIADRLDNQHMARLECARLAWELEVKNETIRALTANCASLRTLTHDHKNHLNTLTGLLAQNEFSKARELIAALQEQLCAASPVVNTRNPVLDAIFNQKYLCARQKGITLEYQLQDLSGFWMAPADASTVFGNLLDNAIEAAAAVQPPGHILCRLQLSADSATLLIKNSVAGRVRIVNNRVKTTKADPSSHGYGLRNVNAVLNKYNAEFELFCDDNWFTFVAFFPKSPAFT